MRASTIMRIIGAYQNAPELDHSDSGTVIDILECTADDGRPY